MEPDLEKDEYAVRAMNYFKEGYNCSQSVVLAFSPLIGIEADRLLRLASSFGGGFARMREVCGAVSGMSIVIGALYGYSNPKDKSAKTEHYARIQQVIREFAGLTGSMLCHEMLGFGKGGETHVPEDRTAEYYKKRPCVKVIGIAAAITAAYIRENPPEDETI